MNISSAGLELIRSFEGYHTKLKNGDCVAYRCPAGVWTIGYGCTEGVKPGMVWTHEEAEAALRKEIAKFEAGVDRLVTVDINQNEFDACVSLAYNIGLAGFGRSSVLKYTNKGDKARAAKAFELWNKGGGRVLPGLVSRRKREAALFLKPAERPTEPYMPQAVQPSSPPIGAGTTGTLAAGGAVTAITIAQSAIPPAPPPGVTETVTNVGLWQGIGQSASSFVAFAKTEPLIVGSIVGFVLLLVFLPKIVPAKWRPA